jgi:hypothetical protein
VTAFETDTWPPVRSEEEWHELLAEDHDQVAAAAVQAEMDLLLAVDLRFIRLYKKLQLGEL